MRITENPILPGLEPEEKESDNFALITGLLVAKDRNADNADIKRPVLDFELIYRDEEGIYLERIPALLSGGALARSLPGLVVGGIYVIGGSIRNDINYGLYIEVTKLVNLSEPKKKSEPLSVSRVRLMESELCPNHAFLSGVVTDSEYGLLQIESKRKNLTKGDLTRTDKITVDALDADIPEIGDYVVCMGQVCSSCIFADAVHVIAKKQGE